MELCANLRRLRTRTISAALLRCARKSKTTRSQLLLFAFFPSGYSIHIV